MIEGLGHPSNALALAQIKAAVRLGVRPSTFRHEWAKTDQAAIIALMEHERREATAKHGPCGQPVELAFNPLTAGWWEPFAVQCQACLAMAEYERAHKDDEGHQSAVTYVVSTLPAGVKPDPMKWPHVAALRDELVIEG